MNNLHVTRYNQQFMINNLPELKSKQLHHELETWKRLLDFMMNENIYLKNRLSQILQDKFEDKLLAKMEDFQNAFLKEDQLFEFLRNEVAELEDLLNFAAVKKVMENEIDKKLFKLQGNMITAESEFGKLKLQFNSYLSENI